LITFDLQPFCFLPVTSLLLHLYYFSLHEDLLSLELLQPVFIFLHLFLNFDDVLCLGRQLIQLVLQFLFDLEQLFLHRIRVAAVYSQLLILFAEQLQPIAHLLHFPVLLVKQLVLFLLPLPLEILHKSPQAIHLELQVRVLVLKSLNQVRIHLILLELIDLPLPLSQFGFIKALFTQVIFTFQLQPMNFLYFALDLTL